MFNEECLQDEIERIMEEECDKLIWPWEIFACYKFVSNNFDSMFQFLTEDQSNYVSLVDVLSKQ